MVRDPAPSDGCRAPQPATNRLDRHSDRHTDIRSDLLSRRTFPLPATVSGLTGTPLDGHLRNAGTILRDGCASFSPELHEFALGVLENLATITTVDDFVESLG